MNYFTIKDMYGTFDTYNALLFPQTFQIWRHILREEFQVHIRKRCHLPPGPSECKEHLVWSGEEPKETSKEPHAHEGYQPD